jgi:hypothetical protein
MRAPLGQGQFAGAVRWQHLTIPKPSLAGNWTVLPPGAGHPPIFSGGLTDETKIGAGYADLPEVSGIGFQLNAQVWRTLPAAFGGR